ncbi:hypothetical protein ACFQ1S_17480, partial [Kibdelosporangium lantanae]
GMNTPSAEENATGFDIAARKSEYRVVSFTGVADSQIRAVVKRVEEVLVNYPEAAGYVPAPIL